MTSRPTTVLIASALAVALTSGGTPLHADPSPVSQLNWVFDGAVQSAARLGNTLYVGGTFTSVAPSANALGSLYALSEATGAVAAPTFPALNGQVWTVEPDGSGGYFVAGDFTSVGTTSQRYLAHVLSGGSHDATFAPVLDGPVGSVARIGATLYVAGSFTMVGGVAANHVGAVATTTGARVAWLPSVPSTLQEARITSGGDRLIVTGADVQPTMRSAVAGAYDAVSGAELWRQVLASGTTPYRTGPVVRAGTRVIVAHNPGFPVGGGLANLSLATGAIDASWNPQVTPVSMALSGNTLYLGGFFQTVAGQTRQGLAAIDLTTAALLPWNPGPVAPIVAMAASSSGAVYVTGLFGSIGGQPRHNLAQIDAAGAVTPWVADARPATVSLIAEGVGGTVLISSALTASGGVARAGLAAFDLTTGALLPWAPPANSNVRFVAAAAGRVYFTQSALTTVVDAVTGVSIASLADTTPFFADDTQIYWAKGPEFVGPFTVERAALATGAVDPSWRPGIFVPLDVASDATTLYFAGIGIAAVDKVTGKVRWQNPTANVRRLTMSGDTLYTDGGLFAMATFDARTGAPMASQPFAGGLSAMTMADGRLVVNGGPPGTVSTPQRPRALTLDGRLTAWDSGVERALIGGTRDTFLVAGNLLVAGGIFGRRPPPALQGLAVFPLTGATAPSNLRARPKGAATEFTWDGPAAAPVGYVLEAGLAPGQTVGTLPLGNATSFSVVVPPGTFFVRVRTTGAVSGTEEVTNEVLVRGGCTAAPPPPRGLDASVTGTSLSLTWTPPDALVSSYTLGAGSSAGLSNLGTLRLAGGQTAIAGAVPPGSYFVRLAASNACGTSGPSGEVSFTIGATDVLPAAPVNLAATAHGGRVAVSWAAPAGVVTGYVLEAGSDLGLADLGTASLGPPTSLVVPSVPPGLYLVRVRAVNAAGSSAPSGVKKIV